MRRQHGENGEPVARRRRGREPASAGALMRGALGGALIGLGARRGGSAGLLLQVVGAAIAAATISPTAAAAIVRTGERRRWVDLRRTFFVALPIHSVFRFFGDFENFRTVFTDVESVVDFDDGRSRWSVRTRGGALLQWDAIVTKWVPSSVIAWHSVPRSTVESAGLIRFAPAVQRGVEGTCVEFHLWYRPRTITWRDTLEGIITKSGPRRMARDVDQLPEKLRAKSGGANLAHPVTPLPDAREEDRTDGTRDDRTASRRGRQVDRRAEKRR